MGNQHSASHAAIKPRKNVHWKSAGRPAVPGKPDIIPGLSEDEPNAITLRWAPAAHDGGASLQGYQVECNRLGSAEWIRTAPPIVLRPELVLTGLEPPHRYQFRVAAVNAVGRSEYSELSDVLTVHSDRGPHEPPVFLQHLEAVTALENDKTEFRVTFSGIPTPTIAWFKDDYEIFSSRRTAITTTETSSVLVFHQTLASDEGEIKCSATNRAGYAITKARLFIEVAPKLRYPRQYEDGLLYEINETVFLKLTVVGKPTPTLDWCHDGQPIVPDERVEISNTPKFSMLKIHSARRSDRGEYQVHAKNEIGEDTAAFLITITAPPDPPRNVMVLRQVDKSVTLDWEPPEDDGGCRIGNYIVEYYRTGWNVWLKATTSRKPNVTLFDLIEGSEYRFRVKAESPYGMSAPSSGSSPVRIPGRPVDMEFLAVESRIINEALTREDGEERPVSPAPRRKRTGRSAQPEPTSPQPTAHASPHRAGSNEFMLVLYPDSNPNDKVEKRKSFQLDLEDALSPPPLSLSAPDLSSRTIIPFKALRNAVSSTELLHERAMARFYKAVAMKEEQNKQALPIQKTNDIPYAKNESYNDDRQTYEIHDTKEPQSNPPEIFIKTSNSAENVKYSQPTSPLNSDSATGKWREISASFDEDYTASTASTEGDYSDEGSLDGDVGRDYYSNDEDTYNPRDKMIQPSQEQVQEEQEEKLEIIKPVPLPDPNFVPKPILKKREPEPTTELKLVQNNLAISPIINKNKISKKFNLDAKMQKSQEAEKKSIFKRITKMPLQKPFTFSKLHNKKDNEKQQPVADIESPKTQAKDDKPKDKINEEGLTVIDYYTNIVKEYGSLKKSTTPLYLNTDDLKTVAEKQQQEEKEKTVGKKKVTKKKTTNNDNNNAASVTTKTPNNVGKKPQKPVNIENKIIKSEKENKIIKSKKEKTDTIVTDDKTQNKLTQKVILKTAERATIVIPIDYNELEKKAKVNVRSAIDYMVDMCLLVLAFWVYFFKDERLAIPFLILIIYRQLHETIMFNIPEWIDRNTPSWLKKKTS